MIHQPLSPDGVHPQISSFLRLLVLCLVRPNFFVIYYCLFIFSKRAFLSLVPLTNATRAFSIKSSDVMSDQLISNADNYSPKGWTQKILSLPLKP